MNKRPVSPAFFNLSTIPCAVASSSTLFKVAGNCSVEITCVRCKKEIVGVVDEIYMKIFENCRGKEHDQEKASRYSTDMEALRQRKRAM